MSTIPATDGSKPPADVGAVVPSFGSTENASLGVRPKRWTREEYHRLGEQGWFNDRRVELIGGEIIEVSPQSEEHFYSIELIRRLMEEVFPKDAYWIRSQGPINASEVSEPEPDIAITQGMPQPNPAHPTTALLAIEVSKTTQSFDKNAKSSLYASAKIGEYWVLDLKRRELTLFRKPIEDLTSPFGWKYSLTEVVPESGHVSPLAASENSLAVSAMLPPARDQIKK